MTGRTFGAAGGPGRTHARVAGTTLVVLAASLAAARPAAAQGPVPWEGPRWWMSVWFGGLFPDPVDDPDTGTWFFGDNVGGGAELGFRLGEGAFLIGDLSYTRTGYDRAAVPGLSGDADILTTNVGVRYSLFSGPRVLYSPFGVVGIGAVHYRLSDLGDFDTDFSVVTGGGLDWRVSRWVKITVAAYDFLVFHQRLDTRSRANLSHVTELRLGVRWGL